VSGIGWRERNQLTVVSCISQTIDLTLATRIERQPNLCLPRNCHYLYQHLSVSVAPILNTTAQLLAQYNRKTVCTNSHIANHQGNPISTRPLWEIEVENREETYINPSGCPISNCNRLPTKIKRRFQSMNLRQVLESWAPAKNWNDLVHTYLVYSFLKVICMTAWEELNPPLFRETSCIGWRAQRVKCPLCLS